MTMADLERKFCFLEGDGGDGGGGDPGTGGDGGDPNAGGDPAGNGGDPAGDGGQDTKTWRDELITSEDLRNDPGLKDYKDIDGLVKSHVSLQKMMGNSFKRPEEGADQSEWDTFYNKLGRPEKPEDYQYERPTLPEGVSYDEAGESEFLRLAHAEGFTQKQAAFALNLYNERLKNAWIDNAGNQQRAGIEAQTNLKKEWGGDYTKKMDMAQNAFKQFATPEDIAYMEKTGKGNDPVLLRMFATIGERVMESEDITANNDDWLTSTTAKKEAQEIRTNSEHPLNAAYFDKKHKDHGKAVERMEQLTAMFTAEGEAA